MGASEMDTKKPWQSKTLLLNGILGLVAFVSLFWAGASSVSAFLNAHGAEIAMFWSILNIGLRAITKDKIVLVD
jgi:hypothetical protein